jgi:hypothetical protein
MFITTDCWPSRFVQDAKQQQRKTLHATGESNNTYHSMFSLEQRYPLLYRPLIFRSIRCYYYFFPFVNAAGDFDAMGVLPAKRCQEKQIHRSYPIFSPLQT